MNIGIRVRRGLTVGAALLLGGCFARPLAVVPLNAPDTQAGGTASQQFYSIHDGIKPTNRSRVTPKAWKRAQAFCKGLGEVPQEELLTQQWPPVRDFVFSCVPAPSGFK
jgi:hypothetical protein